MPNFYLIYWARLTDSPPLPLESMLNYYPEEGYYIIESGKGFAYIDPSSAAFEFCEHYRHTYGAQESRDTEGEFCLNVSVPKYRVEQIKDFVRLETTLRYCVSKGL